MSSSARRLVISVLDALLVVAAVLLAWPVRLARRALDRRPPLSVWTGAPIINMAINARAERLLRVRTASVVPYTYYITSRFDWNLQRMVKSRHLAFLLRWAACLAICATADRVHAYVDGGILPQRRHRCFNPTEMGLYRLLGIPVFVWTYGADVRMRVPTQRLGEPNCCTDCTQVGFACICSEELGLPNYEFVRRNARAVFSMGDMIEYTAGSRNDLFFWPLDLEEDGGRKYRPAYPDPTPGRPLRIVHAPNHRQFKGTAHIERAVAELRAEGVPVELTLVERVPNDVAMQMYREADLVLDQVMVGYHGFFALEAMALGKPVMCFIRDRARYLLKPAECPMLDVHLSTLKQTLRDWALGDRARLAEAGRAGRRYVEDNYSLAAFARRLGTAYGDLGLQPAAGGAPALS